MTEKEYKEYAKRQIQLLTELSKNYDEMLIYYNKYIKSLEAMRNEISNFSIVCMIIVIGFVLGLIVCWIPALAIWFSGR